MASILIASGEIQLNRPQEKVTIHLYTDGVKVDKENTNAQGDFFADITARPTNTVRIMGEGGLFFKHTTVIPNEDLPLPAKLEYGVNDLKITIEPIQIPMNLEGTLFENISIVFTQKKGADLKIKSGSATMIVLGGGSVTNSATGNFRNELPLKLSLNESGIVATLKKATKIRIPFIGKEKKVRNRFEGMSIIKRIIPKDERDGVLVMEGTFRLDNAPPQLDIDLEATFDLVRKNPTIKINKFETPQEIRKELNIQELDLTWTLQDARRRTVSRKWEVAGNVTLSFWGNEVKMTPSMLDIERTITDSQTGEERRINEKKRVLSLTSTASPVTIGLDDWGRFDFTSINLKAVKNEPTATWELSSQAENEFTVLPKLRHRAFDLFADFLLENYQLGMTDTDLVLQGRWLEEDLTFVGKRIKIKDKIQLIMEASTKSIPLIFDYEIPPILATKTNVELFEGITLTDHTLDVTLDLELTNKGLLTKVNSDFSFQDKEGTNQLIHIPPFTLFTPPPNKNALLGNILEELTTNATEIFTQQRRHKNDFFLTEKAGVLSISLMEEISNVPVDLTFDQGTHEPTAVLNQSTPVALAYDQLLAYYYGWNKTDNYIDLVPGMRLRIDFQNYQFVQATEQKARRGFAGTGSTYYYVNSYLHEQETLLGFDTFLSNNQVDVDTSFSRTGGGSIIDLLQNKGRKKLFRLFYPEQPGTGIGPERVATLIGTDTYSLLQEATKEVVANGSITTSDNTTSFYLRGRATIIPEIPVFVGETMVYVSVGTTWRQLLERFTAVPPAIDNADLSKYVGRLRPLRLLQRSADSKPTYVFINVPATNKKNANNQDYLDLPLVKGDRFFI